MVTALRGTLLLATVVGSATASALSLTGICGFPTDAAGNWHTGWYNTYGPDAGKNAYLVVGPNLGGAFVNSGNGLSTEVSIDLSTPGDYTLYAFFDGDEMQPGRDFWGVNLFFDGDRSSPAISAFARPQRVTDVQPPEFWANSGTTLDLEAAHSVSGSNSLSYTGAGLAITMSRYATTNQVFTLDRVDNFWLGASGRNDHVTVIGLHVVPEPASIVAVSTGVIALLKRRRKTS